MVTGGHVEHKNILKGIIVDIGNINPHTVIGNLLGIGCDFILKSTIALVDKEGIGQIVVARQINIQQAVRIDIGDRESQAKNWALNASFLTDLRKRFSIIAI